MNILPMLLNILAPWLVFVLTLGLLAFRSMHAHPILSFCALCVAFLAWLGLCGIAARARKQEPEPTWLTYFALAAGIALFSGVVAGLVIFVRYTRPFYQAQDMKVLGHLDPDKEFGSNVMDAGVIHFSYGSKVDPTMSWHFKHGSTYCVAPIVNKHHDAEPASYDFWAVGTDCCSVGAADFRCNTADWTSRSGIRVLDDAQLPFYRLAVQQAETMYGVKAAHPLFFYWSRDPLHQINSWRAQALKEFVFLCAVGFVVSVAGVLFATFKFSFLGRGEWRLPRDAYYQNMQFQQQLYGTHGGAGAHHFV